MALNLNLLGETTVGVRFESTRVSTHGGRTLGRGVTFQRVAKGISKSKPLLRGRGGASPNYFC